MGLLAWPSVVLARVAVIATLSTCGIAFVAIKETSRNPNATLETNFIFE
jgi:hypothetical protein